MVQKWQKVKKEVELEERDRQMREAEIRRKLAELEWAVWTVICAKLKGTSAVLCAMGDKLIPVVSRYLEVVRTGPLMFLSKIAVIWAVNDSV